MKKISNRISHTLRILCMISFLILISLPDKGHCADPQSAGGKGAGKKGNNFELFAEYGMEYIDNVYQLTSSQIWRLQKKDQADRIGGRYKDMESVSDIIVQPSMGLKYNSGSPLGGKLTLTTWVRSYHYMKNDRSTYPEGRIRLKNTIGKKGALTLEGTFLSGFFRKNYMSAVIDADRNGNIPREERIYSPAYYDEHEGVISYEYKLISNKDNPISGLEIQPFAGISSRTYNSTFSNRNQDTTLGGLGLDFEFNSWITLEMIYQYEKVASPNDRELILIDENRAETDANSDMRIKSNAALTTDIDRSRNRYTIEINPSFQLYKDVSLYFSLRRRISAYSSDNRLDIEHYNQRTSRNRVKAGISHNFLKGWSAQIECSRTNDYDDEDGDFLQNTFLIAIKYNFK